MTNTKPLSAITLDQLDGIGRKRYHALQEKGLSTLEDFLRMYPRDYLDRRELDVVKTAVEDEETVIKGTLTSVTRKGKGKKERLVAYFEDDNGDMFTGVWFRGFGVKYPLQKAGTVIVVGKPSRWRYLSFTHPNFYNVGEESFEFGRIVPVYASGQNLKAVGLSQRVYRKKAYEIVHSLSGVEEIVPEDAPGRPAISREEAFKQIHFPDSFGALKKAKTYLKYEELYALQALLKRTQKKPTKAPKLPVPDVFTEHLPFTLTDAQARAVEDIENDMISGYQMNRLVQGDVGAGKTVVAVAAVLAAAEASYQCAFMAPTEILAEQHCQSLAGYLKRYEITPELLTSSRKNKTEIRQRIADGDANVVVGTHALLTQDTTFRNLGLAVIDEQHRFGVRQRQELFESQPGVHMLLTTATPIPRSYAQTFYGDLDVSTIDEMPAGRKPVETYWPRNKEGAYDLIFDAVQGGAKAFVVCPMIEEDEDLASVETKAEEIVRRVGADGYNLRPVGATDLPWPGGHGVEVFVAHGQMKSEDKQAALEGFENTTKSGAVLVSTTVIEVGIDVPDATIILIEDANQFGLSQLHQLRGRVGRSDLQSYCFLMTAPERELTEKAVQRMEAMISTTDGFEISKKDMQIRGTGSIVSESQSGYDGFRIADLRKDKKIAQHAHKAATENPTLAAAQAAQTWFEVDVDLGRIA